LIVSMALSQYSGAEKKTGGRKDDETGGQREADIQTDRHTGHHNDESSM